MSSGRACGRWAGGLAFTHCIVDRWDVCTLWCSVFLGVANRPVARQVYFKPNSGYKDVLGVAWPMRTDLPKARYGAIVDRVCLGPPCLAVKELKSACCLLHQKAEAERAAACAKAAAGLVNIDDDERKRRVIFGIGLTVRLPLCC